MIDQKIIEELKTIVEGAEIDPSMFPYKKGNSIRIGHIAIREKKNEGYMIYDCKENKMLTYTFSKTAAVAIAKNLVKGRNNIKSVLEYDRIIEKNFMDAVFFTNTIRNTKNDITKEVVETRLEIARTRTENAKKSLDCMIFS